jgi:hypothetical protein
MKVDKVYEKKVLVFPLFTGIMSAALLAAAAMYAYITPANVTLSIFEFLVHPWVIASLINGYVGIIFFMCWVVHREKACYAILWIPTILILGNLGAAMYILVAAARAEGDINKFWNGGDSAPDWSY